MLAIGMFCIGRGRGGGSEGVGGESGIEMYG